MSTVSYRGYRTAEGAQVILEVDGRLLGPLNHIVRHSPTGMTWGYAGSGPADLARSLLVDALGEAARCPTCDGVGRVVWAVGAEDPRPFDFDRDADLLRDETPEDAERWHEACFDCDHDGVRRLPYQDFKFEVVANLPAERWTLPRQQVRDWLTAHGVAVPA